MFRLEYRQIQSQGLCRFSLFDNHSVGMFVHLYVCLLTLSDILALTGNTQWEETQREIFCLLFSLKMPGWYEEMKTDALESREIPRILLRLNCCRRFLNVS